VLAVVLALFASMAVRSDERVLIAPDSDLGQRAISIARAELERNGVDPTGYWGALVNREGNVIHVIYCPYNPIVDPIDPSLLPDDPFFHVELDATASRIVKTWFSTPNSTW
jgi:hypothetical protein